MVWQKRLEYGFNGYQVPRAPRSARKRKKEDHNRMCAFDLLATVAGELLLEGDDTVKKIKLVNESENEFLKGNDCDQETCNKSFFVSEIIKSPPVKDTCSGLLSGFTVSDCKNGKPPVFNNVDCNINLVIRDDVEHLYGPRIGDRRIRRLSASKQWKYSPHTDMYRNKKNCYKYQRSIRDYPFKKRRFYQLDYPSNSDNRSDSVKDDSGLDATAQDSHVKLKIKSFRVPEFFIEIPETATVSSLKRTVMEAVTAIFSGELHVGVMLQGKRIRDDNKTLLQTGICHDNKLDALGFTLEPSELQIPSEDRPVVPSLKSLTRYSPPKTVANQMLVKQQPDSPVINTRNVMEDDRDSRALATVPGGMNAGAPAVRKSKGSEVAQAQRRIRRPFSVSEVEALVEAVEKLGTGRWRDVKLRAFDNAKHRTYVDLKDKWKTLVHTARISPQQRRGEPVPQELLDRVLLAHGYWSHLQAKNQFKNQLQTETCRLV